MKERASTLYYALWIAGGVVSLLLTIDGCFASIMLDLRNPEELGLALCLVLPFPSFVVSLFSRRWSAALLWFIFVALWFTRAQIRPNPELNPVDTLGALYLLPAIAVQLAVFFAPKKANASGV